MALSKFLKKRKEKMKQLVSMLGEKFSYVSILGTDQKIRDFRVDSRSQRIGEGFDTSSGFVLKLNNGRSFCEYSFDDLNNVEKIYEEVMAKYGDLSSLDDVMIRVDGLDEEKLEQSFVRKGDLNKFSDDQILDFLKGVKNEIAKDPHVQNATAAITTQDISKVFVSKTKCLDQNYTWVNGMAIAVYGGENGKVVWEMEGAYSNKLGDVIKQLPKKVDKLLDKCSHLVNAKPIEPGIYDIITHPSISGLIAHEAFGHGVEMDQFTKNRALGKEYVGKYVASPVVNMKDGANSAFSVASYFFDDDGILAGDTDIIKDGILVTGISDMVSASILKTCPTGNGRRESYKRKAYTRMTNTFFLPGKDNVKDMIKSVKHGYMLFETNNGMEDPKNWGIQCTCEYGIEIVDGKLTDNWVSPVVISGYVPDLLKSITMVSKDLEVIGAGQCGKGYKEWVRVSDGGPYLKGRVKLS